VNRLVKLTEFKDVGTINHVFDTGDALLAQYDYTLSLDGKRIGAAEKTLVDGVLQSTKIDWLYDALGRLTEEKYDSFDNSLDFVADYAFDLVGNRLSKKTDKNPTFTGDPNRKMGHH
jgi:hypothetical protein